MEVNAALDVAIDAINHVIKEKIRTAYYPDKAIKILEKVEKLVEAIEVLEKLKNVT